MPVAAPPPLSDTALRSDLLDALLARRERFLCQAMRVLGSRDQAEDILQEAALRCLDCPLRREQIARPQAWLGCMVRNLAIDQYRRRQRQPGAEPVSELPCPQADPERLLLDRQRLDLLERGLDRVPVRDRRIFLDHRLGGVRQCDLATRERLSPARINAIIARVHAELRETLEPRRQDH